VHSAVAATSGLKLHEAQGDNPNPFYQTLPVKSPLVSTKTTPKQPTLASSFVYDFPAKAGQTYSLKAR
jgi:alpha-L-fucosidase 2